MDHLWAPWRMQYIQKIDKEEGCIFCNKPSQSEDRVNLILCRGKHCFVIMNLYPYNNGHLMVVPYVHTSDIITLDRETSCEMWDLVCLSRKVLAKAFKPDAFNIGMNIGRAAGAGIDQHIHMHIVPRWNGDTNYITVISETKIISQGIHETYDLLLTHFQNLGKISSEEA
jgi:ATP adenylyltransferase